MSALITMKALSATPKRPRFGSTRGGRGKAVGKGCVGPGTLGLQRSAQRNVAVVTKN